MLRCHNHHHYLPRSVLLALLLLLLLLLLHHLHLTATTTAPVGAHPFFFFHLYTLQVVVTCDNTAVVCVWRAGSLDAPVLTFDTVAALERRSIRPGVGASSRGLMSPGGIQRMTASLRYEVCFVSARKRKRTRALTTVHALIRTHSHAHN
jgi:hypothetical protein